MFKEPKVTNLSYKFAVGKLYIKSKWIEVSVL
jgi:hypothetical protein